KEHYMVDIRNKLKQIMKLIARGHYFTINRPRQYGKTTVMYLLANKLRKRDYLVIKMSFEGLSSKSFADEAIFIKNFVREVKRNLKLRGKENLLQFIEDYQQLSDINDLKYLITDFIREAKQEVVLMIDEVDKSSNNQLFLDFLGMLRTKYLLAKEEEDYTFHNVILAGVHDVKNLKLKLRSADEKKYNSPWNIAVKFKVEMSFNVSEIETMISEYKEEKDAEIEVRNLAQEIYYYTSGHPYLVSKLAKIIDEELEKTNWDKSDIQQAVKVLLNERNTNFESLIKNIENNKDLHQLIYKIIVEGEELTYNLDNPIIELGALHGILKNENGIVKVHNKIYEQRIYNYLSSKLETTLDITTYNYKDNFIKKNGYLDFEKVLNKFQLFIKEQYSSQDKEFLERKGRLLFLAFIKPIINGRGFDFKEVQISQEKRLDVVVTYLDQKYIVELKIWRGEKYHQKGLEQLGNYLDTQNVEQGYLVSFNFNQNKEYKQEKIEQDDKEIFAIWV
ncbi:MAG: AAA-like domain-containing protein, partial [Halanaerobacter sp.]